MSPAPSREEEIFYEVIALPAPERTAFLDQACGGNASLRARVEALLSSHEDARSFMQGPAADLGRAVTEHAPIPELGAGDRIARYKLLQKLGEGGCGVVYLAEQEEPVRRRVAVKVIKLGMDTKEVIARFDAERQALALMDHPHIARVFDAGATDAGRPYFVMELVRGMPITKYCDEQNLSTTKRLELFTQVCHAVQHAHQKGIIHRDLKPSNILVTQIDGTAAPKVIDFGIAKATAGRLTDATLFTAFEQFIGTPAYMSPEQAELSGLDIDTRSDIYSLGVLLYELLTGRPPFDPKSLLSAGLDEVRRIIREVDPPRMSTRLNTLADVDRATIARQRGIPPAQLSVLLRGDLDWIVIKSLEKDRTRRYETASGLARDIQRHLHNEPVVARPPSAAYFVGKMIRRHRLGFAAAFGIFAAVSIGAVASTWQAVRARRAEREQFALREAAQQSQASEKQARLLAEKQRLVARQRAYAADMNLAQQSLIADSLGRAKEILDAHVPAAGERDLRGWEWRYLWQFCQSDAQGTLREKGLRPKALSASYDGTWVAAGADANWSLWNLRTGAETQPHVGNGDVIAFSPRDPLLALANTESAIATAREQYFVVLWNPESKEVVHKLELSAPCSRLAFSGDGQFLVTWTNSSPCYRAVWQVATGKRLHRFSGPRQNVNTSDNVAVSFSGRWMAERRNGNQIFVVDLTTGKTQWSAVGAEEYMGAVAFSPDEKVLASGAAYTESVIRLWDAQTGCPVARLDGHSSWVSALVFLPDGKTLVSASGDQTIKFWDIQSRRVRQTFRGHTSEVDRLVLLADGRTLISSGKEGAVHIWDVHNIPHQGASGIVSEDVAAWGFGSDGRSITTASASGEVTEWTGDLFQKKQALFAGFDRGRPRFSDDTKWLAFDRSNGAMQIWDVARRTLVKEFNVGATPGLPDCFIADGKRLVLYYPPTHEYREVDIERGTIIASWPGPAHNGFGTVVSPDEKLCVAFGSTDGTAMMRDMQTGRSTPFTVAGRVVRNPKISPDGRHLAVAISQPGSIMVWDLPSLREDARLGGFMLSVHSLAFSPDNARLAAAGGGREALTLWDLESRQRLLTLSSEGSVYNSTAFSRDGAVIGSRSDKGVLRYWKAPSWAEITQAEASQKTPRRTFEIQLSPRKPSAQDQVATASSTRSNRLSVRDLMVRADEARARADYARAISDYTAVIGIDGRNTTAFNNRALCKRALGDYAASLEDFDAAIKINSRLTTTLSNRGTLKEAMGDFEGAIADYEKVVEFGTSTMHSQIHRFLCLERLGRKPSAQEFSKAVATWDEGWSKSMGRYLVGEFTADDLVKRAARSGGSLAKVRLSEAHHLIGVREIVAGRLNRAAEEFEKAIAAGDPTGVSVILSRAELIRTKADTRK